MRELSLNQTAISDSGIKQLRELKTLQKLYLHSMPAGVSQLGICSLQEALPSLTVSSEGRLSNYRGPVNAVAFSPDGKRLASCSADKSIRLWELATSESRCLEGHNEGVQTLAFSPDGRILASGGIDGTLRLWDVATGLNLSQFPVCPGEVGWVTSLAFSPDGKVLASGTRKDLMGTSRPLWLCDVGRLQEN